MRHRRTRCQPSSHQSTDNRRRGVGHDLGREKGRCVSHAKVDVRIGGHLAVNSDWIIKVGSGLRF